MLFLPLPDWYAWDNLSLEDKFNREYDRRREDSERDYMRRLHTYRMDYERRLQDTIEWRLHALGYIEQMRADTLSIMPKMIDTPYGRLFA